MFVISLLIVAFCCALQTHAFSASMFQRPLLHAKMRATTENADKQERIKTPSIFLGSIPYELEEADLVALVKERLGETPFRSVILAKNDRTGKSKGFAYINFHDESQLEPAIAQLAGLRAGNRDLIVDISGNVKPRLSQSENFQKSEGSFEGRSRRSSISNPEQTIYIGNLDFSATESQILDMCADLLGDGMVQKVRISVDRDTGRPRGFAHVDFRSVEDAKRAIEVLDGISLLGRTLRVNSAVRKDDAVNASRGREPSERTGRLPSQDNSRALFLGNLSWEVSSELLNDMLNDILGTDTHTNIRLAIDRETGRSRGFAHVEFKDVVAAERALVELNGISLLDRTLRVDMASGK